MAKVKKQMSKAEELEKLKKQLEGVLNERPAVCRLIVFFVLSAIGYFAVLDPGLAQIAKTKLSIKQVMGKIKKVSKAESKVSVLKAYEKMLPPWTSNYSWMENFLDAARQNKVRLDNMSPVEKGKSWITGASQVDIDLALTGTYRRVVQFMSWIETQRPFYRIVGVSMEKTGARSLKCVLSLKVFQQKQPRGAKS